MREDLAMACRFLGVIHRWALRQPLREAESLLVPAETVQVLAPGWWRAQRSLIVVTTSRVLLVRRQVQGSSPHQATYPVGRLEVLRVEVCSPEETRFRVRVGLDLEEFSVTRHGAQVERVLRTPRP